MVKSLVDDSENNDIYISDLGDMSKLDATQQDVIRQNLTTALNLDMSFLQIAKESQDRMRKWKGERMLNGKWVPLPDGKYYDYYTQQYCDGIAPLTYFDWYCEFMNTTDNFSHPMPMGRCHQEWGDILMDWAEQNSILLCPRDHYKSTYCNVGFITYVICEMPEIAKDGILTISWSQFITEMNLDAIKQNLDNNSRILSFYDELRDKTRQGSQTTIFFIYQPPAARPGLNCVSFQSGAITGQHPALCVMDDIQDTPFSERIMHKAMNIFTAKLFPAMGAKGRIIVTGTVKGHSEKNDIYLWLNTRPQFNTFTYPAVIDKKMPIPSEYSVDIEERKKKTQSGYKITKMFHVLVTNSEEYILLYPERYKIEDLVVKRLQLFDKTKGDDTFWSEYMLEARDPKGFLFHKERIGKFPIDGYNAKQFVMAFREDLIGPIAWVDPGGRGAHGITYVILAKHRITGKVYLLQCKKSKIGIPMTARSLKRDMEYWGARDWGCEGNVSQKELFAEPLWAAMMTLGGEVKEPVDYKNSTDKELRIRTQVSGILGMDGDPISFHINPDCYDYQEFFHELTGFPNDMTQKGAYDILDATGSGVNVMLINRAHFFIGY